MSRSPNEPSLPEPLPWPQIYLGVALTSLATLVLELALTRIFSVVFQFHFAFLAISVALFGLGAGGLFSYALPGRGRRLFGILGGLASLNGILVVGSLTYVLTRSGPHTTATLALIYLASALPFFLAGCVIATVIAETVVRVGRIYFFDLLGAAAGCLLLVPLLDLVGGPGTVIGAGVLFAASGAIWYTLAGSLPGRVAAVGLALAMVALVISNAHWPVVDVHFAKGEELRGELYVKWNSFSRVAVLPADSAGHLEISIDGAAASGIADVDLDNLSGHDRSALLDQGPALPYALRPGGSTLVISPGGGWDIARAVASGSREVIGVESNPIIANTVMRDRFAEASQRLYFRPEVRLVVGDARSFVRSTDERFDILQATQLGQPSTTATAGALAFVETNLLTTEAFRDFLARLRPDGVMAFSRWSGDPPRESLRIVAIAMGALLRLGERDPRRHLIVIRETLPATGGETLERDTILVARKPLAEADLTRTRAFLERTGMRALCLPDADGAGAFADLLASGDPAGYAAAYPFDISPVSDNRPFFFYTTHASALWDLVRHPDRWNQADGSDQGAVLLVRLLAVTLLAMAAVLLIPPLVLGSRLPRDGKVQLFLWYFVFVGAGYILVQVALIQKFVLFLGNPTYALTVVIFAMLLSSGVGSYHSRRIATSSDRSLKGVLAAAALLVASLALLVSPLVAFGAGWPMPVKVIVTLLVVSPAGFVMGMPFPAGLARLETRHLSSVRWAWSLNAAASVLGSACAMFLGIHLGLRETLLVGGVMYLGALMAVEASGAGFRARAA